MQVYVQLRSTRERVERNEALERRKLMTALRQRAHCVIGARIPSELYERVVRLVRDYDYRTMTEFIADALELYAELLERTDPQLRSRRERLIALYELTRRGRAAD
jgi:Arc/MetJ-type ribon-helix-helix transcriptional regulator